MAAFPTISFILFKLLMNVDFPHPEGPITAVTLFARIFKEMSCIALLSPKDTLRERVSIRSDNLPITPPSISRSD